MFFLNRLILVFNYQIYKFLSKKITEIRSPVHSESCICLSPFSWRWLVWQEMSCRSNKFIKYEYSLHMSKTRVDFSSMDLHIIYFKCNQMEGHYKYTFWFCKFKKNGIEKKQLVDKWNFFCSFYKNTYSINILK